jgi:hypothetical protein
VVLDIYRGDWGSLVDVVGNQTCCIETDVREIRLARVEC